MLFDFGIKILFVLVEPRARQSLLSAPILHLPRPILESQGRDHVPCVVFKRRESSSLLISQEPRSCQVPSPLRTRPSPRYAITVTVSSIVVVARLRVDSLLFIFARVIHLVIIRKHCSAEGQTPPFTLGPISPAPLISFDFGS